jgi:hypothetical protein
MECSCNNNWDSSRISTHNSNARRLVLLTGVAVIVVCMADDMEENIQIMDW